MGGWRTTLFDSEMDGDGAGIENKFQKGQFLLDIRGKKNHFEDHGTWQ